jgi:peptide-methionine (R)-S-oxide reductase
MDHRHLSRMLALGRVGLGIGLTVAPRRVGRAWVGGAADDRSTTVLARALGVRDVALGAGVLTALDRGDAAVRDWVTAAAVADAVDAVASAAALGALPRRRRWLVVGVATASAVAGWVARDRMG